MMKRNDTLAFPAQYEPAMLGSDADDLYFEGPNGDESVTITRQQWVAMGSPSAIEVSLRSLDD